MAMPLKHWWHSWLTRNWDEAQWEGWEGTSLRCFYMTAALLATLLVAPSLLSVFLHSFTMGFTVSAIVFAVYAWLIVGHYPEPRPED